MAYDTWPQIHAERAALADRLGALPDDDWSKPSLCAGWSVKDVAAHITATGHITAGSFFAGFIGAGFKFNTFAQKSMAPYQAMTTAQLVQELGQTASMTAHPPGPKLTPLGEIVVHAEDIGRALGQHWTYPEATLVAAADYLKKTQPLIGAKKRIAGLRLEATDASWSTGSGPEVKGPAASLILAMAGRRAGTDDLTGPGVDQLRALTS